MKKLLLSTAFLGLGVIPVLAQDQTIFREAPEALEVRASDFMGMRLYATETAPEGEEFAGVQEGWDDIGEVKDVVLDRDGQVQAVLVDIGGFLGIGERTVAVSMDALQFLSDSETAEDADDYFLVINASREQFESAPAYTNATGGEITAGQAADETEQAIDGGASDVAAGAATGATAVEGAGDASDAVADTAGDAATTVVTTTESAGDEAVDAAGTVAESTENAVEETGEELGDAGAEVADEAADAGEEVAEEANQVGMTDTQEDQVEAADTAQDSAEEAAEETAQAADETADEQADQAEAAAEGNATETEMETDQTADMATDTTVADETATTDEAAATETTARTPITREGYVAAGAEDLTADRLQGAAVYDANDERVGEVGELLLSDDGSQVSDLVIDVGGFLGIGEKPVALPVSSVDILRQDGGDEIRVYVSQAEDELKAMPDYEAQ